MREGFQTPAPAPINLVTVGEMGFAVMTCSFGSERIFFSAQLAVFRVISFEPLFPAHMGAKLQQVACNNALPRKFYILEETQSHHCFARLGRRVVLLKRYGECTRIAEWLYGKFVVL